MLFHINKSAAIAAVARTSVLLLLVGLVACGTDERPDGFSFVSEIGQPLQSFNLSNSIIVTGVNTAAEVSIEGGEYIVGPFEEIDAAEKKLKDANTPQEILDAEKALAQAEKNLTDYRSRPTRVYSGYEIRVRVTAAGTYQTEKSATLTINGVSAAYSVTTEADRYPPITNILFPPPSSLTEGSSVNIAGSTVDTAGTVREVTVQGVAIPIPTPTPTSTPIPAPTPLMWKSLATLTPGLNNVAIRSKDDLANETGSTEFPDTTIDIISAALTSYNFPDNQNTLSSPLSLLVNNSKNQLLVVDRDARGIAAINTKKKIETTDPFYGARTIFSNDLIPIDLLGTNPPANPFTAPVAMTFGLAGSNLLVLDNGSNKALLSVNLIDRPDLLVGARTVISSATIPRDAPANANPFVSPSAIAFDAVNSRALVIDQNRLLEVNLGTGERKIVSSDILPDNVNPLNSPTAIVYDAVGLRALVANRNGTEIIAVNLKVPAQGSSDPVIGKRTIISSAISVPPVPDTDHAFVLITGMALDRTFDMTLNKYHYRLFVVDDGLDAVLTVNLEGPVSEIGKREVISSNTVPNAFNPLQSPSSIAIDPSTGRIYVADTTLRGVFVVNDDGGDRVIISK